MLVLLCDYHRAVPVLPASLPAGLAGVPGLAGVLPGGLPGLPDLLAATPGPGLPLVLGVLLASLLARLHLAGSD